MRDRLKEFSLSLHPEKALLIEFGRDAAANRKRLGFENVGNVLEDDHVILPVGAAVHPTVRGTGGHAILLMSVVTRSPCAKVLDLNVEG